MAGYAWPDLGGWDCPPTARVVLVEAPGRLAGAPRPSVELFDPAGFARPGQTLYLLSKDGAGSVAPLGTAFADRVMLEAVRAAEISPGERLDPSLLAVLDEAANTCRITELPRLHSPLGSRGIVPLTILQSRTQGRWVWGAAGMDELFGAATVKVIGAGIDDPTTPTGDHYDHVHLSVSDG